MLVSMDVISVNNETSSHFETSDVVTVAPPIVQNDNLQKFENRGASGERLRRKRKTRRFKSRYKNKSSKKSKYQKQKQKKMRSRIYPQSEAPNNTNQFLMAEHDLDNLDDKLAVPGFAREGSRARESSFTSVDSEEVYSSPDDNEDDEYFAKDFDNTYQSVCAELSTKVNGSYSNRMCDLIRQVSGIDDKVLSNEIKDIIHENERLRTENEALQRFIKDNAVTWSSSSSSSSSDSDSDSSDSDENSTENATSSDNQRLSPKADDNLT